MKTLRRQRDENKHKCENMMNKLEVLWDCLDVCSAIRTEFRHKAQCYHQSSITEIEAELKRCITIKRENIKLFVEKLRVQIVEQWNKINLSESERNKFTYFKSQVYTEDLLELHEMELEDRKRFYEENR